MIFNILLKLIGFITKEAKHVASMYDVFNIKVKYVKCYKLLIVYPQDWGKCNLNSRMSSL